MCGISGFTWSDPALVSQMVQCSLHRGPDYDDTFVDDTISLGHSRLAIIGATPDGRQPMEYSSGSETVMITYNGELYNFQELRSDLVDAGYSFVTETDTEVICAAYLEWGSDCVNRFNGMWAFTIYDPQQADLFLSRDRLGIKPLYYSEIDRGLVFGSEIKSILECDQIDNQVNEPALSHYLMFRGVLGEETQYESVMELLPGHNLYYDLDSDTLTLEEYWDATVDAPLRDSSIETAVAGTKNEFNKSIERRLIADVGVGAILSGGLDSSTITGYMDQHQDQTVDTYTVRFESDGFDEGEYAREVSEYVGTDHTEVYIGFEEFIEAFEEFAALKDMPIGVPNEVALYILSEQIREDGNYVVLSGEGADEIFYGYSRIFRSPFDFERIQTTLMSEDPGAELRESHPPLFEKYGPDLPTSFLDIFIENYTYWSPEEAEALLNESTFDEEFDEIFYKYLKTNSWDNYRVTSYLFLKIHLPILLNRADNSTMANAVESRVPFLDHELVELAFSLPNEYKSPWLSMSDYESAVAKTSDEIAEIHDNPKYPIKQIARGHIPDQIIDRKKKGFPVPFLEWKDQITEYTLSLISEDQSELTEYIDRDELHEFIESLNSPDSNYQVQQLWMLASLELWLRNWT